MNFISQVSIPGVPDDLAKKVAQVRGEKHKQGPALEVVAGKNVSDILPVSGQINSTNYDASLSMARAGDIGGLQDNKGVYMGLWKPRDASGRSLGKVFDIYAAPTDLQDEEKHHMIATFDHVSVYIDNRELWYGYHGISLDEESLQKHIVSNPEELQNWFIPPEDILLENLYHNRDRMPAGSEFITVFDSDNNNGSDWDNWYWSCTNSEADGDVRFRYFHQNDAGSISKKSLWLSTRLVRDEVPQFSPGPRPLSR